MRMRFKPLLLATGLVLLAGQAYSQTVPVAITYAPLASIPTLSEGVMLALAVLMGVVAFFALRKRGVGRPMASLVLFGALALVAAQGEKMIGSVHANGVLPEFTVAGGSTVAWDASIGWEYLVTNRSGVTQTITAIMANGAPLGFANSAFGTPKCVQGLVVPNLGVCYLRWGGPT